MADFTQLGLGGTKMKMSSAVLAALAATLVVASLHAQVEERPLPRVVKKDGRFALFVDDAPYLMLGAQVHNSSSWPVSLPKVWPAMEYLNVNTVEMPIYWEQFEPQPNQYDYTMIDTILTEARQHHVHLVLLWFGTWKNGSQHYTPEWMKLDLVRYPHMVDRDGQPVDSPSPHAAASLDADKTAFSAFMRHLKESDPQRTVLMVQVENEAGAWGSVRDFSPAAQKLFEAPVPPELLSTMHIKTASASPNWQQAFGPDADEYFHAWSVAKYIGQVAAAGKAVYPLPMYANAALRDPFNPGPPGLPGAPGNYESGGPTDNVLSIWKAAAPALDILAPDDYQNDPAAYLKVLELYHRDDNALFVPETGGPDNARFFFSALGLQTIGFAPFGLDYTHRAADRSLNQADVSRPPEEFLTPWAMNYRLAQCSGRLPGSILRASSRPWPKSRAMSPGPCRSDPGTRSFPLERPATIAAREIRSRRGALWLPSLKTTSFWWPDYFAVSTSARPAPSNNGSPSISWKEPNRIPRP
jgi:hypothetical protein